MQHLQPKPGLREGKPNELEPPVRRQEEDGAAIVIRMSMTLAAGSRPPSRASGARLGPPRCPFPLPDRVIDAPPARLCSEHILGIYVSRECLARRALHRHVALRSYISLIRDVERREP